MSRCLVVSLPVAQLLWFSRSDLLLLPHLFVTFIPIVLFCCQCFGLTWRIAHRSFTSSCHTSWLTSLPTVNVTCVANLVRLSIIFFGLLLHTFLWTNFPCRVNCYKNVLVSVYNCCCGVLLCLMHFCVVDTLCYWLLSYIAANKNK